MLTSTKVLQISTFDYFFLFGFFFIFYFHNKGKTKFLKELGNLVMWKILSFKLRNPKLVANFNFLISISLQPDYEYP